MKILQDFWKTKEYTSINFAFFRIAIAFISIAYIFVIFGDAVFLYGSYGLVISDINDTIIDNINMRSIVNAFSYLGIAMEEPSIIHLFLYTYVFFLFLLMIGFATRVAALVSWLCNWTLMNSCYSLMYGFDIFTNNCLLYCVLLPVGFYFAVDQWIKPKKSNNFYNIFSIRILQIHLCIIYFFSGINKLFSTQWWNGEAIWRSTMQPPMQTFDLSWMAEMPIIPLVLGIGVILMELSYPILILKKRIRYVTLVLILSMHLMIGLLMQLHFFAAVMMIMNITALCPSTFFHRVEKKVRSIFTKQDAPITDVNMSMNFVKSEVGH